TQTPRAHYKWNNAARKAMRKAEEEHDPSHAVAKSPTPPRSPPPKRALQDEFPSLERLANMANDPRDIEIIDDELPPAKRSKYADKRPRTGIPGKAVDATTKSLKTVSWIDGYRDGRKTANARRDK